MSDELLPCPFCGGAVETEAFHSQTRASLRFVRCRNVECDVMVETNTFATDAEAIAAWNTRLSTRAGEADRLYEAIKHGDEVHRAWLREALDAFFADKPIPAPRATAGERERVIEVLEALRMREEAGIHTGLGYERGLAIQRESAFSDALNAIRSLKASPTTVGGGEK